MQNAQIAWDMTEKDYQNYKNDHKTRNENGEGMYGCCRIGKLKVDFQHTLDKDSWYPYGLVFCLDRNDGYGDVDGRPYALLDGGPDINFRPKTFESFKKMIESSLLKYIEDNKISEAYAPLETCAAWGY